MTQLNLSLDDQIVVALESLAEAQSLTRDELVKNVLVRYVRASGRQRIHDEMRSYAEEMAPYSNEIVSG